MKLLNILPLLLFLVLLAMLPFVFGQLFTSALIKLKLEPTTALLVVIGIFLGSPINIPVKRISRTESVSADSLAVFGLSSWWPMLQRERRETVVAVTVCYWLAKPIEGIGIAMPSLFPALLAAVSALFLVPHQAPPVAFAGVLGPLIGADLLHLRDIEGITTVIASIGGAGTFDGIVLSGIVAAYLA